MPGRPPKPTALHLVEGTRIRDGRSSHEPKLAGAGERPPSWLKGRGRAHWKRIRPLVVAMGVLSDADVDALALLCDALAEYTDATDVIRQQGATYEAVGKYGLTLKQRPEVALRKDAWRRANLMLQQFGLSPSSRAKVSAGPPAEEDPLDTWMSGKRA